MSIDYLCTSPAAQGANTEAVINQNICAPAEGFASRHGHIKGLPSVQLQGRPSEKSGDRGVQENRSRYKLSPGSQGTLSSYQELLGTFLSNGFRSVRPADIRAPPEGQGKGEHPNAERKGQKQASRHNTYGHVPSEGSQDPERKLRGQPLSLKTDLHTQKEVPELRKFPLAEPNRTTENTGGCLANLQAAPDHQAVLASQDRKGHFENDAQDVIEARSRSLIKNPRQGHNSFEAAKTGPPLSRNKDSRTLDKIIPEVERKSRADLQAMTVPLFDQKGDATRSGGERVKADCLGSELTAPDLAISHKDRNEHTNSVDPEGSMKQDVLAFSKASRKKNVVTGTAFGGLRLTTSRSEGVSAALDKAERERPPQKSLGCVITSAQEFTRPVEHDNASAVAATSDKVQGASSQGVCEVLNKARPEDRHDSSAEAAFRIKGVHNEKNLNAAFIKASAALGEREPHTPDRIPQDGGVSLTICETVAQDRNKNKCSDPGKACEPNNFGESEAMSQERVTVDAVDDQLETQPFSAAQRKKYEGASIIDLNAKPSEIETDIKSVADEGEI